MNPQKTKQKLVLNDLLQLLDHDVKEPQASEKLACIISKLETDLFSLTKICSNLRMLRTEIEEYSKTE